MISDLQGQFARGVELLSDMGAGRSVLRWNPATPPRGVNHGQVGSKQALLELATGGYRHKEVIMFCHNVIRELFGTSNGHRKAGGSN